MSYETILAILKSESDQRKKRTRTLNTILLAVLALQAGSLGYLVGTGKESFGGALISLLPMLALLGASVGFSPKAKSALIEATKTGDTQIVGHLCEALASGDPALVSLARTSLKELFPLLTESAEPLDKVQHAALLHGMRFAELAKDLDFIALAVRALAKIGRAESISTLEQYTKVDDTKLRAAALVALPDLRMRLAREIIQRAISDVDARRELKQVDEQHLTH